MASKDLRELRRVGTAHSSRDRTNRVRPAPKELRGLFHSRALKLLAECGAAVVEHALELAGGSVDLVRDVCQGEAPLSRAKLDHSERFAVQLATSPNRR